MAGPQRTRIVIDLPPLIPRGMFEDQAFYAKLMLAERVLVVDRSWERYRQHADSMCGASDGIRALCRALRPYDRPQVDHVARQAESLVQWLRDRSPLRSSRTPRDRS